MNHELFVLFVLILVFISAVSSSIAQKFFTPNEQSPFVIPSKFRSGKWIVEMNSQRDKQDVIEKGCSIQKETEEVLVVNCPKDVKPANARRERLFVPEIIDHASAVASRDLKPKDIIDAEAIRVPEVWDLNITGKGRIIAILDTGIDYNHTELKSSYIGGKDFVNGDDDPKDDYGHGTHVAGIITSDGIDELSKGVAPDAKLIVGKVCGFITEGNETIFACPEAALIEGLEWASNGLDGIPRSGDEPDAVSISLGSLNTFASSNCDRDVFSKVIARVVRKGVLVVVSAGNYPFGISSPACSRNSIVAGSIGGGFPDWYDYVTGFSGRGYPMKHHGVVAPGVFVYSTVPTYECPLCNESGYEFLSGTSMSAPYVAGVAALIKEAHPNYSADRVKTAIFRGAESLSEFAFTSEDFDAEQGHGRIDALNSVS